MGVANVPAASAAGLQPKYQKFTSSGTFTLPTGYGAAKPLLVNIQVIGGGGGGSPDSFNATNNNLFVNTHGNYFGAFQAKTAPGSNISLSAGNTNGAGGGSGGLAQTQMYLTSNLTITVGAAGARAGTITFAAQNNTHSNNESWSGGGPHNRNYTVSMPPGGTSGGTGGISTAGAVSAVGGGGATANNINANVTWNGNENTVQTGTTNAFVISGNVVGNAGQPAGSAGDATPLLGALAGGSGNATPVYGAFGVSGKRGDGASHSGVDGTGGGVGSIGASGAVILTWWE